MVGGKGGKVTQRMVVEGIVTGSLKGSVEEVLKGWKKGLVRGSVKSVEMKMKVWWSLSMCLQGRKKNQRETQMSGLLESTIRSLHSKLHSVATFTVVQSLLMVLVYLMHTHT